MRPGAVAVVSLVAAVIGGISSLAAARSLDWVAPEGDVETVVVSSRANGRKTSIRAVAKPLPAGDFDPPRIYTERSPGVVTVYAQFTSIHEGATAQGSGFVVSEDGLVLTNSHVITTAGEAREGEQVKAADRVFVEFSDRDRIVARVVGWDVFNDVGVLRVDPEAHGLTVLPLGDSDQTVVGEPVAAIGSPFGNENSLAIGIVSARRAISALTSNYSIIDAIQTDAPINQGNSGGPLLDARGRVIGINAQIRSETGRNEGVGFAIPVNTARRAMEQLVQNGRVRYAFVGIRTDDVTPTRSRRFGISVRHGAIVTEVTPGSGASKAGLRGGNREAAFNGLSFRVGGDVIVAIDGEPVRNADDVIRIITQRLTPGDVAVFTIVRDGERKRLPVRLGERPAPGA